MSENLDKIEDFLEKILPIRLIEKSEELKNFKLVNNKVKNLNVIDGFCAKLYAIELIVKEEKEDEKAEINSIARTLHLVAKFTNFDEKFTEAWTVNELTFYSKLIPAIQEFLLKKSCGISAEWAPKFYNGFFGFEEGLGDECRKDSMIVMENMILSGYQMGPRLKLDENHVILMTKSIAEFHASFYALKIQHPKSFQNLVKSLVKFNFSNESSGDKNMFDAFYSIALEKLKILAESKGGNFKHDILKLYTRYIDHPSSLLQIFLQEDSDFDVIIHGDYNRNNVMFKYPTTTATGGNLENPLDVKMFDFQWVRCASPVLDLSFYIYMNLDPDLQDEKFDDVLKFYHQTLVSSFKSIMKDENYDENLPILSLENFMNHFKRFAFYGCLISVWFLPVMMADEDTCLEVTTELSLDMFSDKARRVCLGAGGQQATDRIMKNVSHAYARKYLDHLI